MHEIQVRAAAGAFTGGRISPLKEIIDYVKKRQTAL